jgi:hypothetical protein
MTTRRPKGTGCIYQRPDSAVFWLKYSGGLNRSVQHHLMNDFLKVVFYDTRKTGQAFHGAAGCHVAPLEGRRVVT